MTRRDSGGAGEECKGRAREQSADNIAASAAVAAATNEG
jgi:hypothetical protein